MYSAELEISFQQNISDEFLGIVNQLRKGEEPGRIFELTKGEPTKDELKFLTSNYGNEIGLIRSSQTKRWRMIEGTYHNVYLPEINADIAAHYHPKREVLATLPSLVDIFSVNISTEKHFIIREEGLTYYSGIEKHPFTERPWEPSTFRELELVWNRVLDKYRPGIDSAKFAESYLNKMGVNIVQKPWQKLPNNPFSGFKA